MAVFRCKMCGGQLEITEGTTVCSCDYCGTEQTLPRLDSDKKANLYDRANHFRRNNDFDKAMSIYEQILNEDNTDAEAYWSLVICKYGIEYVEDPVSHKRIPTVNRAQFTSIYDDENYKQAIANADSLQKSVYEQEANAINEIQKGILAISSKEEPFDVFICYKETDETGRRTPDSVLANDLYHQLTQEGFKVFFARITLEDKLGQEYEPYIFAALNSSKVMVVLGTKPEYYKAVWVKNEWSRYLSLIRQGEKKMLIPAYKDMDPYDLPEEFSHLQAQDMTKLGFMQDLIRGIKKILGADQPKAAVKETVVVQQGAANNNVQALLDRGNMALEDGEWEKADGFFEEVLNQDAKSAEAYLGKLLAKCKRSNVPALTQYYILKYDSSKSETLEACQEETSRIGKAVSQYKVSGYLSDSEIRRLYEFDRTYESELSFRKQQKNQELSELGEEKLLTRANQYASGETKTILDKLMEEIIATLDKRIEDAKKNDDEQIAEVKSSYEKHLAEADEKAEKLYNNALERQESTYNSYVSKMNVAESISDFEQAKKSLKSMLGYKDTDELAKKCQVEIDRLKEEERLKSEREAAVRKEAAARQAKKKKTVTAIVAAVVVVAIVTCIVITKVVIPNSNYKKAVKLMNNGKYIESYELFDKLDGYKDSGELKNSSYNDYELEKLKSTNVGGTVFFGDYNGNTEWIVLAKENGKVLVISKYAIEKRPYNIKYTSITWEKCTLRSWLNGEYITSAFSSDEQSRIGETTIENLDNAEYGTKGGNNTVDKVFLLSIDEVNKYFASDSDRKATLSDGTSVWWWLRSPGLNVNNAAIVDSDGSVNEVGSLVDLEYGAVRPALWISID